MEKEKKKPTGKIFFSILLSSLLATGISFFFEKVDIITKKSRIGEHFQHISQNEFNEDINIVLEKEAGEYYFLLCTKHTKGEENEIRLVRYKKMDFLPLYEFEQYYNPVQSSVGSDHLNNSQFIVYGNREKLGADYFTYRKNIKFKRVSLPVEDFFIHIETNEDAFLVPRVNFYSEDRGIVASTIAK
jgi:hypothetical protein